MKLDRNINPDGRGKYALIKLREGGAFKIEDKVVVPDYAVDFGNTPDTEFFVIRLKDKYAEAALEAYSKAAAADDPEWAAQVFLLADKAACHPNKRRPD